MLGPSLWALGVEAVVDARSLKGRNGVWLEVASSEVASVVLENDGVLLRSLVSQSHLLDFVRVVAVKLAVVWLEGPVRVGDVLGPGILQVLLWDGDRVQLRRPWHSEWRSSVVLRISLLIGIVAIREPWLRGLNFRLELLVRVFV